MVRDTKPTYSPLSEDDNDATTHLLAQEHEMFTSHHICGSKATSPTWTVVVLAVLVMSFALSTIFFAGLWFHAKSPSDSITDLQLLYSPAVEAIEYEVVKFHSGPLNNEEDDIYSLPPSPEVDAAWRDLYEVGTIVLTESEASHLVNKTMLMKDDKYVVGIDVFHQLHCLNKIRKALYPRYYLNDTEIPLIHDMHITHCLNSIRQSLQCSSDIGVVVFQEQSIERLHSHAKILPSFNVQHSCRSFHGIQEWVKDRWAGDYWDNE